MSEETTTLRCYRCDEIRIDDGTEGQPARITGLAVPYNALSEDLGGFRELFRPGAFTDSLADDDRDVRIDIDHDAGKLLARRSKGRVDVSETKRGVRVSFDVPDTTLGRDTLANVRNGNFDAMSVAFSNPVDTWKGKDTFTREITKADLHAVTLTSFPAYRQTAGTLAERALSDYKATCEEDTQIPQTPTSVLGEKIDLDKEMDIL